MATKVNWENILAALCMFVPSVIGLVVYSLFTIAVLSKKQLRTNSYYMLAIALGAADCSMLCLFAFYSVPKTMGLDMGGHTVDVVMGVICNLGWFASLIIIAETAINRYICICKHNIYNFTFSFKHTKIMIAVAWAIGCVCSFPSFHQCCYILYFPDDYTWGYIPALGATVISYVDLSTTCAVGTLALVCNTMCFLKIRGLHAKISPSVPLQEVQRRKLEKKLFVQFFIISTYLLIFDISFNVVSRLLVGKWVGLAISVLYIGQCSINSYVYVGLNMAIREQIAVLFGKTADNSHNSTTAPIFSIQKRQANTGTSKNRIEQIAMSTLQNTITDVPPNAIEETL